MSSSSRRRRSTEARTAEGRTGEVEADPRRGPIEDGDAHAVLAVGDAEVGGVVVERWEAACAGELEIELVELNEGAPTDRMDDERDDCPSEDGLGGVYHASTLKISCGVIHQVRWPLRVRARCGRPLALGGRGGG